MAPSASPNKRLLDKVIIAIIGFSIFVVAGSLVAINFWDELGLDDFFGSGELPLVDFEFLSIAQGTNHYLACPTGYCLEAEEDETSPVFLLSATNLRNRLIELADSNSQIDIKKMDLKNLQFDFLAYVPQRTFPDVVTVKIYDIGGNESSVAIYSRTLKGEDNTNENRTRVKRWLRLLEGQ